MGLHMSERKAVIRETRANYQKADKKAKGLILDQFVKLTGYARKYAIRVLAKRPSRATLVTGGKTVVLRPEKKPRPKNRLGKRIYTKETIDCLEKIWWFYRCKCGPYLAEIIRQNIDFLVASRKPKFHLTPGIRAQLAAVSGRQIDRLLKPVKDAEKLRGISGTKRATETLLKTVPVRTHYTDQERNTPGFCQTDTVHHCGDTDSGEFNLTLTVTDVSSGWIWLYGLLNKAHKWTLEGLKKTFAESLFNIIEFHSDCGSEFINHDTIDWVQLVKTLGLSHSRSYHKNDNCFAEQKNNAFVRNYVGFLRYDTLKECDALNRVYEFLCPLVNYFIPNKKLLQKTKVGSKVVKVYDKELKTPYRRLMESSLTDAEKERLTAQRVLLNPVELQYNLNHAIDNLLEIYKAKVTFSKCPTQEVSVTF
jgi:hypothetical protein